MSREKHAPRARVGPKQMKKHIFGNPHDSFIEFSFDDLSVEEQIIVVVANTNVSWYKAHLPIRIQTQRLVTFLRELASLYETLKGNATFQGDAVPTQAVILELHPTHTGHIICDIKAEMDGNLLKCTFKTDQTQLPGLHEWFKNILKKYDSAESKTDLK